MQILVDAKHKKECYTNKTRGDIMEKYAKLQTIKKWPEYPKIERLNPKNEKNNNVYRYVDKMELIEREIFLQFMCDNKGRLIGKVWNNYFDREEIPKQTGDFWLTEYKIDLLNRILEDLLERKEEQTIHR